MLACADLDAPEARFSCYDAAIIGLASAFDQAPQAAAPIDPPPEPPEDLAPLATVDDVIEQSPDVTVADVVADPTTPPSEFGAEQLPETRSAEAREEEDDSLAAIAVEVSLDSNDRLRVVLDNGQVWRQLSSDRPPRQLPRAETPAVTITRGLVGGYRLKFEGQRGRYSVRRVR